MSKEIKYLTASKVANLLDVSVKTLTNWYRWYTSSEFTKPEEMPCLPMYEQTRPNGPRLWKESDVPQLINFKNWVPKGRKGVMGDMNSKYWSKKDKEEE